MFLSPMLLQYAKDNLPFNSSNHIAELKLDGIRLIVSHMDQIKLYTRNGNNVTAKFPELVQDSPVPPGTILDGELILTDQNGKPDFEAMMARFQSRKNKTPATFVAFDILRHRGIDVTGLPLMKRKELLAEAFQETDRYKLIQIANGQTMDYFEIVKQNGLEGIVIKDKDSKYEVNRRSWNWQKVINWTYAEICISGFRKKDFGWLACIENEDGQLRPAGIIELGVIPEHKKAFNSVRGRLIYKEDKHFVYMEPILRAKVKTRNWTKNGMLRSPIFMEFII
ncbi:RNA ligase family protein [Paenibacillus larvae]|uniref:ATP-dependent DNA ligase n=2 Tax=Paenibacillus larvae TaxID=1464 RepID=UPI00227E15E4|nr:RNA ligase family protein [Paenibacillus larvae]MCY9746364.1 DNA ligase [Paenibacillus larvae]